MLDTFQRIDNLPEFAHTIKKEAIKTFILSYKESDLFLSKYDDNLLSFNEVEYELKQYLVIKEYTYYVDTEQIEAIVRAIYQQLVYKVMGKLVDDDILEMCWDSDLLNFVWRKKKYARISKLKKNV